MKKEKGSIISAIKILWKVTTPLQKVCCVPMFIALFIRAFAALMPIQCIAAVVAKLEGETPTIFGIALPDSWSIVAVSIFVFSLVFILWIIGSSAYYGLWAASGKLTSQINDLALKWALTPRKNMDLEMSKGELCYLIKSSTDTIQDFIETLFIAIIPPIASFVLSITYIGLIDWAVVIMILGASVLLLICAYLRVIFERKPLVNVEVCRGRINNLFLNSITNLPFISLFKCFAYEKSRLKGFNDNYYSNVKKRSWIGWTYWAVVMFLEYGSMAAAVIIANSHTVSGVLSISSAVLLLGYILNVYDPIEGFGYNISSLQQNAIKISRINLIKPREENIIAEPANKPEINEINKIEMKDICLKFGSFHLDNFNVCFGKGEMVALAGPSGSGKSSIVQALLGLREREGGEIIVNDSQKVDSLFFDDDKISYALQEMELFDRALKVNLLYPDLQIDKKAEKIIKSLGIDKILEANADKEEGFERTLSGGEKKRINIARALIKQAQLYILDEPTNELDPKNVEQILKILSQLKKNSIVIVVSHDSRLTNICDKVIYF